MEASTQTAKRARGLASRWPRGENRGARSAQLEGAPIEALVRFDEAHALPATETRRDALYRRALALGDMLSAALAVTTGVMLLGEDTLNPAVVCALPLVVGVGKLLGLYERDQHLLRKTTLEEAGTLFQVATLYTLVIWLSDGLFIDGQLGREQVGGLWALLFLAMVATRGGTRRALGAAVSPERCLVVGDADLAERLRRKLAQSRSVNAVVVGHIPLQALTGDDGVAAVEAELEPLRELLTSDAVERIVVAPGQTDSERTLDALRVVRILGTKVSVLPGLFEVIGSTVEFDDVDGLGLLGVRREGLSRSSQLLKRGMDVTLASAGLLVLAPLMIVVALAIRLTSPGPVLFRQKRIGRLGEQFEMLKFRTMAEGAEEQKSKLVDLNQADGLFKIAEDPRLTRVGRFLRRGYLDELPQLFNVLQGEMSLVGPRPLVPEEDRMVEGWHRRRLSLAPGITGPWQLLGPVRVPLHEMVKMDYLYGANWTVWSDVVLILRTIGLAFRRDGI